MNIFNGDIPTNFMEGKDVPKTNELPSELPDVQAEQMSFTEVIGEWIDKVKDFFTDSQDVVEAREYGIKECADVAKDCFTQEVIQEWGTMSLEERNEIVQEYAAGIGEALGCDFKGVIWEEFPYDGTGYTYGYNAGDGYVHLNVDMLVNPAMLMDVISTTAHEARHQLQNEAILNPEKFPIDEASINEWAAGKDAYTTEMASAYDPWGYQWNPMETDARYFGESMVREITKDIINDNLSA